MGQGARSWAANASFDNSNEKDSNLYLQIALRQIGLEAKLSWCEIYETGCLSDMTEEGRHTQFLLSSFGTQCELDLISKVGFPAMWDFVLFK